jgi:UDP-N-acetylmuramoyl-tripeptide--D-alanyl-D-alanine ligase
MAADIPQTVYGTGDSLYINGQVTGNSPCLALEWKNGNEGQPYQVQTRLIGAYNLPNVLAAVTIGFFFGVEPEKINRALADYTPQNNRSQLKKTENNTLIIDAYNANPASMAAALENFKNMSAPHKVVILGDMRELGTESAAEHQKIIDYIHTCHFEQAFLVGENFAATKHAYTSYATVQELIAAFQTSPPPIGKTILIKGSNGVKLGQVVEFL